MWGAVIGGAMGLMGANKQAKSQDRATEANMAGFNQYKPYVDTMLEGTMAVLHTQVQMIYRPTPQIRWANMALI